MVPCPATEFLRAKIRVWAMYAFTYSKTIFISWLIFSYFYPRSPSRSRSGADPTDATDIIFALAGHWNSIDINRIPEDVERFIQVYPQAADAWNALRARYE
jgi:hypothetical protein